MLNLSSIERYFLFSFKKKYILYIFYVYRVYLLLCKLLLISQISKGTDSQTCNVIVLSENDQNWSNSVGTGGCRRGTDP
jgi:hypothetical protein